MYPRCLLIHDDLPLSTLMQMPCYQEVLATHRVIIRQDLLDTLPTAILDSIPLIECILEENEDLYSKNILHPNIILLHHQSPSELFVPVYPLLYISSLTQEELTFFDKINVNILECYVKADVRERWLSSTQWRRLQPHSQQPIHLHRLIHLNIPEDNAQYEHSIAE